MKSLSLAILTSVLCFGVRSGAQQAEAAPAAPAAIPPDVVLQKDGGMLRGTISELIPGDVVVITLSSGEQRRIAMANVEYAGPASEMAARRQAQSRSVTGAASSTETPSNNAAEDEARAKPPKRSSAPSRAEEVDVPLTSDPEASGFTFILLNRWGRSPASRTAATVVGHLARSPRTRSAPCAKHPARPLSSQATTCSV